MTNEQRVIEAAKAWRALRCFTSNQYILTDRELIDAVDALAKTPSETTGEDVRWEGWRVFADNLMTWLVNDEKVFVRDIGNTYEKSSCSVTDLESESDITELHGPAKYEALEKMPADLVQSIQQKKHG